MSQKYLSLLAASGQYGGTTSAWRKWASTGLLGDALCRFGRLVMVDTEILNARLKDTKQLLVNTPKGKTPEGLEVRLP